MSVRITPLCRRSTGHTLLEMMLSLVLLSIVMATVGSAVMFASQAVPDDESLAGSMLVDHSVLSRIAEDLAIAQIVTEQTAQAVTVVVPDRTGDGLPDRVRYMWTGQRGGPLYVQLNDSTPTVLIDSIKVFNLTFATKAVTQTLPGPPERSGPVKELASETALLPSSYSISPNTSMAQRFTPSLPNDVVAYEPTRMSFYGDQTGSNNGVIPISIRDVDGFTPDGETYATGTVVEADLSYLASWNEITFATSSWVPVDEQKMLVFEHGAGTEGRANLFHKSGGTPFTIAYDVDGSWSEGWSGALLYRLYGYEIKPSNDLLVTQTHLTTINVTLQSQSPDRSPLTRSVRMLLEPKQVDAFRLADFEADPTPMDLNADGVADWAHESNGIPSSALDAGTWTPTAGLIYESNDFTTAQVIRIAARIKSNDTLGPLVEGPYIFDSAGDVLPVAAMLRSNGKGGQELVIYNDPARAAEMAVIPDLPAGWVDVALTVLPNEDTLSIEVDRVVMGSIRLERIADPGNLEETVRFASGGGVANFRDIRIEVGGSCSVSNSSGGFLGGVLNWLGL